MCVCVCVWVCVRARARTHGPAADGEKKNTAVLFWPFCPVGCQAACDVESTVAKRSAVTREGEIRATPVAPTLITIHKPFHSPSPTSPTYFLYLSFHFTTGGGGGCFGACNVCLTRIVLNERCEHQYASFAVYLSVCLRLIHIRSILVYGCCLSISLSLFDSHTFDISLWSKGSEEHNPQNSKPQWIRADSSYRC